MTRFDPPTPPRARRLTTLYRIFIAPHGDDEDGRRQEYILNIILVACIAALLAIEALILYGASLKGGEYTEVPLAELTIFPVFFVFLLILSRKGYHLLSSALLVGTLLLGNARAEYLWGIDLPITLLAYAFIISTAGILLGTAVGFAVTAVSAGLIAGIWSLHVRGIVAPHPQQPSQNDVMVFVAFYLLIMIVSWLSNREIGKSLARARSSEKALARERDLLETRVAERTETLRRIQFQELEKTHRLAEFGRLASGLFHDLLNILNSLSLRTEGSAEDDAAFAAAHEVTRQIRRFMHAAEHQLGKSARAEPFSLDDVIDEAIQLVRHKADREHVRIVFARPREPLISTGIALTFHQVVVNLLTNAIDAYRDVPHASAIPRTVIVRIARRKGMLVLTIKDHGCGIPDDLKEKIFAPFFTTKKDHEGVGIGLAAVKRIVEHDLEGTIAVHCPRSGGTTFTITFPPRPPHGA